jgi:hypothetical protein
MSINSNSSTSTGSLMAAAMSTGKTQTPTAGSEITGRDTLTEEVGIGDEDSYNVSAFSPESQNGSGDSTDGSEESSTSPSQSDDDENTSEDPAADQQSASSDNVDFISVTDHQGRKVKVKVDYSDKDSIKRAYSMAAGARKWQVERDNLKKELDSFRGTAGKKVENWDYIDKAYKEGGVEGLVNFLQGDPQAFDKLVDNRLKDREWRANASPEELALHEARAAQQRKDSEVEQLRKELAEVKQGQVSAKEEAEMTSLKSTINPVFDKYRFADKLGDPAKEYKLDKMLYREAMEVLEALPDDADITPDVIHKAFKDTALEIRSLINQQASQKAEKIVADKRRSATETAQVKAQKSIAKAGSTGNDESMSSLLKQGRLGDIFRAASAKNKNFMGS